MRTLTVFSFVATSFFDTARFTAVVCETSTNESGEKPPKVSRSSSCISGAGGSGSSGSSGLSTFTSTSTSTTAFLEIGGSAIGSGKYCTSTSFSSAVRKQVVDALIKVDAAIIAAESEPLLSPWLDRSPVGPGAQSETASGPCAPQGPFTPARGAPVARVREGEHHSATKCPLEHALSRAPKVVPRHARTTRCRGKRIRAISKSGGGSIIGSFSRCTTFIT